MNVDMELHPSPFILHLLLSHLWLHEPDAETVARAVNELGLPEADPTELASVYADVLLLNVPPYGTVYTDVNGELNGPEAQQAAALYEAHGYRPPELSSTAAPDHVGLCLGFLAHAEERGVETGALGLEWIPTACLAVERDPTANSFYRVLAAKTRAALFVCPALHTADAPLLQSPDSDDELSLHTLLRFFLAPARCGVFLSRSRLGQMARSLGLRLPFGSRFDVAEMLFMSAGEADQVDALIGLLQTETDHWRLAYRRWAEENPAWRPFADVWLARTESASRTLAGMRATAMHT